MIKIRYAITQIEDDGWFLVAQRGSYRQYKHPTKPGPRDYRPPTQSRQPNKESLPKTYRSILKQAQLAV